MKYAYLLVIILIFSCKDNVKTVEVELNTEAESKTAFYDSFGEEITDENTVSVNEFLEAYKKVKESDTLMTKAKVKVLDVCQAKGCWMVVDLGNNETARVKFKDYAFFVPKNIKGKEVIINGKAFVDEIPVEELRHYAEDAGESADKIAQITESKRANSFLADGVLVIK